MNKQNVISLIYHFILETMERCLNTNCNFDAGFLTSDIPRDTIQVVLKIRTKWGKHTLTEDCEKRTEKYRPWEKHAQCITYDPTKRVEPLSLHKVHDSGSSSDSWAWIQASGDLEFTCKIFKDPSSDKENTPVTNIQTTLILNDLNITEDELPERPTNFVGPYCPKCVLKWPRCICLDESDWEDNATQQQQMPLPRTSSPYPDYSDNGLERLEPKTDEELDQVYYRARPANDRRLHKPTRRWGPTLMIPNNCPTPQTSPDYITMVASLQQEKQPVKEVRGISRKKKKTPHIWPKCLKRSPLKITFQNNDLYNMQKAEYHYY